MLMFAITIIAVVWSAIAFQIHEDRKIALREWSLNQRNLTRSFAEQSLRKIAAIDQNLRFVRNQYLKAGAKVDLAGLAEQGAIDGIYRRIGVIDRKGVTYLTNQGVISPSSQDLASFEAQRAAPDDRMIISASAPRQNGQGWSIHLSRRITAPDGSFAGAIVASIDPAYLGESYVEVELGPRGLVSLVGDDGIVRVRKEDGVFSVGRNLSNTRLLKEFSAQTESGSYSGPAVHDGIVRLYTFHRLAGYPLTVISGVTLYFIYERTAENARTSILIGLTTTLIALLFAGMILRLLRRQAAMMNRLKISQAQAESANKMKSEFLASMSHELRTPLHGILSFAEIIQRKAGEEKIKRHAGIIHASGAHLLELLNSILDLAKVEAGKLAVNLRREQIRPLVQNVVDLQEMAAASKHLALTASIADDVPLYGACDATLVRQVLNNLLNNAIKFTEAGQVCLRVAYRPRENKALLFEVADTGIGISPEAQELVFEKFMQADQSETRAHQGTGLGLALVKQLVELMGGKVALASTVGVGTTVSCTIPLGSLESAPAGSDGTHPRHAAA